MLDICSSKDSPSLRKESASKNAVISSARRSFQSAYVSGSAIFRRYTITVRHRTVPRIRAETGAMDWTGPNTCSHACAICSLVLPVCVLRVCAIVLSCPALPCPGQISSANVSLAAAHALGFMSLLFYLCLFCLSGDCRYTK